MENDNDFTFCQVSLPHETKKLVSDIGGITIKDEFSDGINNDLNDSLSRNDKVPDDTTSRKKGTVGSNNNLNDSLSRNDIVPDDTTSRNQGTVGSLSFNVTDMSSKKQSVEFSRPVASGDAGGSNNKFQEQTAAKKPAPRAKVPFEKGYSQMDWLKLTRAHPDLAGLKGQSNKRLISMNEVRQHREEGYMWTVLKGRVYNISPYMRFHPGGVDMLMKAVGKDCTSLFNKYHAWVNADFLLEKCLVGTLEDSE